MIPLLVPCLSVPFAGLTIGLAMEARCYRGQGKDKDEVHKITGKDWFTLVAFAGTVAVLLWLKF